MALGKPISQEKIGSKIIGHCGGTRYYWYVAESPKITPEEMAKIIGLTDVRIYPIYKDINTRSGPEEADSTSTQTSRD